MCALAIYAWCWFAFVQERLQLRRSIMEIEDQNKENEASILNLRNKLAVELRRSGSANKTAANGYSQSLSTVTHVTCMSNSVATQDRGANQYP